MITIHFDGSCEPRNPGGIGTYGFVITLDGKELIRKSGVVGVGEGITNNVAEYTALIEALDHIEGQKPRELTIYGDSQLAIKQLSGEWAVNSPTIKPYFDKALHKIFAFRHNGVSVSLNWIPREENSIADELSHDAFVKYCSEHNLNYRPCKCGGTLIPREGKRGKFFGCSRFPRCKNTEAV